MRFGKVTLRSQKNQHKILWPVKVTLEVIRRRLKVFCWSCDEGHLKWFKKISEPLVCNYGSNEPTLTLSLNGRSIPFIVIYAGKTHYRRFRGVFRGFFRGGQDFFDPQIVLHSKRFSRHAESPCCLLIGRCTLKSVYRWWKLKEPSSL